MEHPLFCEGTPAMKLIEAVGLDENFFWCEADFLGDEASAHEDGGEEGGFGRGNGGRCS